MEPSGNPLDNYEPLEVVGTGSFGTIRKVRRKADGQIFARKELNFERMTERDRKQIVAEVNILKDLDHEHIVRYHDRFVDRDNGILYIVMEYCGGGDLAAIIQRCRREGTMLPEDTIWSYFLQIVLALHQCHHPGVKVHTGTTPPAAAPADAQDAGTKQRGQVLHRDIKPENVFLNGEGVVKMGDFGLSKQLASASFANTYVGTPYYMSPEVMQEKAYDSKSDIWSLGCLLYELCALNPPFHEAKTHAELSHFIRSGRIPPLPRVYSSSLTQVIKAMLNVNPAMRPSAQQLLQHERLDLAFKLSNMEKMVRQVKSMKAQLAAREAALAERERELAAHSDAFRAFLLQKEAEVRAAMEAREAELREAMMARERELCAGVLRREEELRVRWEEREEEIRVAWERRENEMVAREEAVRREGEMVEALRAELEAEREREREKKPQPQTQAQPQAKPFNLLQRLQFAPKTPVSRFALSPAPGSAMKGVVLTSTGEALPTPPQGKAIDHHDVPAAKDLAKLLQASPVVGLDFGRFADDEPEHDDDDERPHSPCPAERERPPPRARKMSSLPVLVAPPTTSSTATTAKSPASLSNVTNTAPTSSEKPVTGTSKRPVDKKLSRLLAAAAAPVYDLEDEENLPSPFIKRNVPTSNANSKADAKSKSNSNGNGNGSGNASNTDPSANANSNANSNANGNAGGNANGNANSNANATSNANANATGNANGGANPVATRAAPARPTLVKRPSAMGTLAAKARPSLARAKAASEDARRILARAGTQ